MPDLKSEDERRVQRQVELLAACGDDYRALHQSLVEKRLAWWEANHQGLDLQGSLPRQAYTMVLLVYMGLDPLDVPVVYEDDRTIVWRSYNFCPTLEACLRLGLDTRVVCRAATEGSVQALIARHHPGLRFSRNYDTGIRPHAAYCEEKIELTD